MTKEAHITMSPEELHNFTTLLRQILNQTGGHFSDIFRYASLDMVGPHVQIALVCIYSVTAVLSIFGNLAVIAILALGKRSSGDLRAFLINLALADVAMSIFSIPFSYTKFMLGHWIFHPSFCSVVTIMQHVSVIVSVYTLTAIGIDRYKAIMYPLERRFTRFRTKVVLVCIWLVAFCISAVHIHVSRSEPFEYNGVLLWDCEERWEDPLDGQTYTVAIFLLTFLLPLVSLGFTYSCVARRLWLRASPGNADIARDLAQLTAKRKIIKMLVTIVVLFVLCWLPLQTFLMLYYFIPDFGVFDTPSQRYSYALAYFTCHWLANANSLVNPLVYCFMSDNFRADLKDLLGSCKRAHSSRCKLQTRDSVRSSSTRTTVCHLHRTGSGSSSRRLWSSTSDKGNYAAKYLKPMTYAYPASECSSQL